MLLSRVPDQHPAFFRSWDKHGTGYSTDPQNLAGRHFDCKGELQTHERLAQRRIVWADSTGPESRRFNAREVAEGKGRSTSAAVARFSQLALGSLCELDTFAPSGATACPTTTADTLHPGMVGWSTA